MPELKQNSVRYMELTKAVTALIFSTRESHHFLRYSCATENED